MCQNVSTFEILFVGGWSIFGIMCAYHYANTHLAKPREQHSVKNDYRP